MGRTTQKVQYKCKTGCDQVACPSTTDKIDGSCPDQEANGAKLNPASYLKSQRQPDQETRLLGGGQQRGRSFVAPSRRWEKWGASRKGPHNWGPGHPIPVHQRNHSRPLRPRLPTSSCVSINHTTQVVGRLIAIMLIPKADRKQIHEVRRHSSPVLNTKGPIPRPAIATTKRYRKLWSTHGHSTTFIGEERDDVENAGNASPTSKLYYGRMLKGLRLTCLDNRPSFVRESSWLRKSKDHHAGPRPPPWDLD